MLLRGRCGLSHCITRYLLAMAGGSLMVIVADPILKQIRLIYFPHSALNTTAACRLIEVLASGATATCVWFTLAFTLDRFLAICCSGRERPGSRAKAAAVALPLLPLLSVLESAPWFFVYQAEYRAGGVARGCEEKPIYFISVAWASYELLDLLLVPCIPFLLILFLNALTVRYVLITSRARRALRSSDQPDPELQSRRRSLVLLFTISGSFVLLWLTKVTFHIYHRTVPHEVVDSVGGYLTENAGDMLQALSSCTNTFIYTVTQARFRDELKRGFRYPLDRLLQLAR